MSKELSEEEEWKKAFSEEWMRAIRTGVTRDKIARLRLFRDKILVERDSLGFMFGTSAEASRLVAYSSGFLKSVADMLDELINMAEEILNEEKISS